MIWGLANMPLAGARNRGGGGGSFPGESGHRRRGKRGGTARGGRALPLGGLDWGWGRPEGARRRAIAEAVVADSGGAALARERGRGRAGRLRWVVGDRFRVLARVEGVGKWGRDAEVWAVAMAALFR